MSGFRVGDRIKKVTGDVCDIGKRGDVRTAGFGDYFHGSCGWVKLPTLEALTVGDQLRDDNGDVYEVASVHDKVVDLADENGHFNESYTIKELQDGDWTVVGEEEETVEVTFDEVAKKMGISVEKLIIKD